MEFQQTPIRFLRTVCRETANEEQTQELRLPESMPDIGRVLCVWGQPLIRSKEWRESGMGLTGGVMARVLYAPEDGSAARCVEAWIPFQKSWEFSESRRDGSLRMRCGVSCMDARSLSARKLMLRCGLGFLAEALEPAQAELYRPSPLPEDVRLLEESYPVTLPREAGEKPFALDETLQLPEDLTGGRILTCSLQPEITDRKVMGDKAVFRGSAVGQALVQTGDGALRSWELDLPFSQYVQLDREYGPEALADVLPALTNLELETEEGGAVRLKAGITGQYLVYDRVLLPVVLDAYSPRREVKQELTVLSLPALLEQTTQTVTARRPWEQNEDSPVELSFYLSQPACSREGDTCRIALDGSFQLLSVDPEGTLRGNSFKWEGEKEIAAGKTAKLFAWAEPGGRPRVSDGEMCCDVRTQLSFFAETQIPMVSGLELGELRVPDPERPSLILRRADGETLWALAKHAGSTVEAIREANGLTGEPEPDRMLLIPVP